MTWWLALQALPWRKMLPALAVLALVGSLIGWHVLRVDEARKQGHEAGASEVQSLWDKQTIADQQFAMNVAAERRAIEQQRQKDQLSEVEHAKELVRIALRDRADADGLRRDAAAYAARRCPASRSVAPADRGASAPDTGLLLPDMLGVLAEVGDRLAAESDRRGIAGATCQALYDSIRR